MTMEDSKLSKLQKLQELRKNGGLSEAEFQEMKQKILNDETIEVSNDTGQRSDNKAKGSHKTRNIIALLVILVIASCGAGVAYAHVQSQKQQNTATETIKSHHSKTNSSSKDETVKNSSEDTNKNVSTKKVQLSDEQKQQLNSEFLQWAAGRAEMGNMAVTDNYFNHGAAGRGDWYANTPDGEVQVQDQQTPGADAFPIHAVGGCVFLTLKDGSTGAQDIVQSTAGGYSDRADLDKPVTKYLLGDNGKVYELKSTDGKVGLSTGFGEYADDGSHGDYGPDAAFQISEDKAAQEELQKLLKKYA